MISRSEVDREVVLVSIASMADGAIQRKRVSAEGTTPVVPRPATGEAKSRTITPLKGASELSRWIPTEAIALYIAILAGGFGVLKVPKGKKLEDLDYSNRWHFFFIMLGVTAALVWLIYAAKTREAPAKAVGKRFNIPVFEMAIAAVAMAAWAAALPDSPFADFHWYGGWFASIVLSTTTALVPLVALAAGRTAPVYEEAKRTQPNRAQEGR
jgi:hypothetical protein